MTLGQQHLETDFRELKRAVLSCWRRLEQPEAPSILRDCARQYIGRTLPDYPSAEELLERLERVCVLSPNAVGPLREMCEFVGCEEGSRLVQNYINKYPPKTCHRLKSQSAPAKLGGWESDDSSGKLATRFSDFGLTGHDRSDRPLLASMNSEPEWPSKEHSVRDPQMFVVPGTPSDSGDVWRTMGRPAGGGQMWVPLESAQRGLSQAVETAESRRRSMALWGHAAPPSTAPRGHAAPPSAVCECSLQCGRPSPPVATPRRPTPRLTTTVEQVLDRPFANTTTATSRRSSSRNSSSSSRTTGGGFAGVTPAGARRARLVDFLSKRVGPRYLQLGEQLETVTSAELSAIASETDSDLVSRTRRLLHLYLGRHGDGDVEAALVRRLRRIRFNRLADELELWSAEQDEYEDPRDWPEDKMRWRQTGELPEEEERGYPSPVRIANMTCC